MGFRESSAYFSVSLFVIQVSLFDPEARFFAPTHKFQMLSRAGAVKVGRRSNATTRSIIARPYLDSPEHDGKLTVVGTTI